MCDRGVVLENVEMFSQDSRLRVREEEEVVDVRDGGDIVKETGSLAPKLQRGEGEVERCEGEVMEVREVPVALANPSGGAGAW